MQLINQELHPLKELRYSSETDHIVRSGFFNAWCSSKIPDTSSISDLFQYLIECLEKKKKTCHISSAFWWGSQIHRIPVHHLQDSSPPRGQPKHISKASQRKHRHHQEGRERRLKASPHLEKHWRNQSRFAGQD